MKYNYVDCEEGVSQYDAGSKTVAAKYVKAKVPMDRGNCFIEALPYPRKDDDIRLAYTKTLPEYNYSKVKKMSKLEKMLQVGTLRKLRFPLPFHVNLEFSFYNALLTSYRDRQRVISHKKNIEYIMEDGIKESDSILVGNEGDATNSGFSLIGYSGCGKSSAIGILTSYYPQVIMHSDGEGRYFPQIVYLVVNCVSNSNFAALYESIGNAIDKAFGNVEPVYAKEIARTNGLGKKAEKVRSYIEKFAIGIIIFDEIQLIDFDHVRENSFDSLMTMANRTKVAVAVVGTEDAREKMVFELRTTRRIGNLINGNAYCGNIKFFQVLVEQLFRYQWFDKPVDLTPEIIEKLYDITKGIVDQLISVYSAMHYDYLQRKTKPKINEEYIEKVFQKFYPGLQDILENLEASSIAEEELRKIRAQGEERVNGIIDIAKQENEENKIIQSKEDISDMAVQLSNITANIQAIYDEYSGEQIEEAYKKIIRKKSSEGRTEKELSKLVIEELSKKPKRKNTKSKLNKEQIIDMDDFLGLKK